MITFMCCMCRMVTEIEMYLKKKKKSMYLCCVIVFLLGFDQGPIWVNLLVVILAVLVLDWVDNVLATLEC